MLNLSPTLPVMVAALLVAATPGTHAQTPGEQWRAGLRGALLTAYSGSVISSNSSLTSVRLCHNGRYLYDTEGSWSVPGQAGGASNQRQQGQWEIREQGWQILLVYRSDSGEQGAFPLYLQNDGKVNVGGTAFAVQQGGAGC